MKALPLILLFLVTSVFGQDEYYKKDFLEMADKTYIPSIRTVQLYEKSFEMGLPMMRLGTDDRLKLAFDDLDLEVKNVSYTIIHCNSSWEPTDISPSEYIDGYSEDVISDYSYSFNTKVRYIHYNLIFPTDVMKIKISGNYVIKVYHENDPENLLLTKRFMVLNEKVMVKADAKQATLVRYRASRQEVDVAVNVEPLKITDIFSDIKMVIMQNGRWDNAIKNLKPLFVNGPELIYDHDEDNTFIAGNEFRYFDITSLRFQSERVNDIIQSKDSTTVLLTNEERRSSKRFFSQRDINGSYVIRIQEGRDPDKDADYVNVRFVLPASTPFQEGDPYIFGQLSDWKTKPEFKMKYDTEKQAYIATVLMKQGYYNYQLVLADDKGNLDVSVIEGSHSEAENQYYIFVYYRAMGTSYEQLAGFSAVNALR